MDILMADGFGAMAKFIVLLCTTVIVIIKSIYEYRKTYKKTKPLTRVLYIMTAGEFETAAVICLCGIFFDRDWADMVMVLVILSGMTGGFLTQELITKEAALFTKGRLEKFKLTRKILRIASAALLVIFMISLFMPS